MPPPKSAESKRRYFSVEEANKTLPLVRAIVADIVRQFHVLNELKQRLSAVMGQRKRPSSDPYSEELANRTLPLVGRIVDDLVSRYAAWVDAVSRFEYATTKSTANLPITPRLARCSP